MNLNPGRILAVALLGSALLATAGLVDGFAPVLLAQRPERPPYYVIRNARIVPVSGPVIESGTVVLSNGLITAVGENVPVPPQAWVIDATGLTVYPGLLDGLSRVALESASPRRGPAESGAAPSRRQRPSQPARGPEDRSATTSWINAADMLDPDDKQVAAWRAGGFTSAVVFPSEGIFPGQGAVIDLAGDEPKDLVVKAPAALRVNLGGAGSGSYPGSLMGVIAYVRQLFLDADQYTRAWSIYEANPAGLERPEYDRTLAPLADTVSGRRPVLIPGNQSREILRAARLGRELGVRTVIYGGQQSYEVAGSMGETGASVLVNLDWPEPPKDADPEAESSLSDLRMRDRAPKSPMALENAGIMYAFYSGELKSPKDVLKNVRRSMDNGLSEQSALRALTLSVAEIYGVADRMGSIEPGKIANLVVTDGDLFAEKTKIKFVFVDGEKFDIREEAKPAQAPKGNLTGSWAIEVETAEGLRSATLEATMEEDGTLSGTLATEFGSVSLGEGQVSGNTFSFKFTLDVGEGPQEFSADGTFEGDSLEGTITVGGGSLPMKGTRAGPDRRARSKAEV